MRNLRVNDLTFPISEEDATNLARAGVIDRCGDPSHGHEDDYHLNPEDTSPYGFEDVLTAIHAGRETEDNAQKFLAGIETIKMDGVIARNVALPMSGDALEKRIKFMQRNLVLNAATTALSRGLVGVHSKGRTDEGEDVSVSLTVIPPGKHATFAWMAKQWVIKLIQNLPNVSDQRKEEIIALIRDA